MAVIAYSKDKSTHYVYALHASLLCGQFSVPTPSPAVTPWGAPLEWSELLRKFTKHTSQAAVAAMASHTRELGLSLSQGGDEEDTEDLALGAECTAGSDASAREEVQAGYDKLKAQETPNSNDSRKLLLAFYAYTLGHPSECISYIQQVPAFTSLSFITITDKPETPADLWATTETIRSICLQGMSHEKLFPPDSSPAESTYRTALPLIQHTLASLTALSTPTLAVLTNPAPPPPPSNKRGIEEHFERYRELWGWTERLLFRLIALTAHHSQDAEGVWPVLALYRECSARWPPKFRPMHRGVVARLHLRALVLSPNSNSRGKDAKKAIREVANDYRAVLSATTTFPRAGERNTRVEEFVDLCVACWQANGAEGEGAGWVIDILWWATRLTFNSPRVFRHMTRLFCAAGDVALARRTLRLYTTLVSKAYQTRMASASSTSSSRDSVSEPAVEASEVEAEAADVDGDADSDANWVDTLIFGARMLCRPSPFPAAQSTPPTALEDAHEAQDLLVQAQTRLDPADKQREARLRLAEGVAATALALAAHDPRTRPALLRQALEAFEKSIEAVPSAEGWWHLAVALARGNGEKGAAAGEERDLGRAVAAATQAVEAWGGGDDGDDPRYWHLLGLLLSAQGKWKQARGVLEVAAGLGVGEEEASDDEVVGLPANGNANVNGVHVRNFTSAPAGDGGVSTPTEPMQLLPQGARGIPPAHTLLQALPDHPRASRQDAFERALQLRMTQVALAEVIEGAEGAALEWVGVFGWAAERNGSGVDSATRRSSLDTTRPVSEYTTVQASDVGHSLPPVAENVERHEFSSAPDMDITNGTGLVPEVTVTPATPALDGDAAFGLGKRSGSMDQESTKGKKVQAMLHKSQAAASRLSTISKKIGNGMVRRDSISSLKRSTSAPDFHSLLQHNPYQASSIHSRRRLSFVKSPEPSRTDSPPPPPPTLSPNRQEKETKLNMRVARENRLLSDLWLMSAATFRRLGKIEQAKGAIQEAEVKDEDNPAVWVQLGLYYMALEHQRHAIDAFHKAVFISPDDVSAAVHLARLYLTPSPTSKAPGGVDRDNFDLAAGMLAHAVKGAAWDVPEAWYYLAKAYNLQGRKDKEREALAMALNWSEQRSIRDMGLAVGWCL